MDILFLSRWFPFPPDNGSKIRIYHLLSGLSKFHEVTLLSFYDPNGVSTDQPDVYPFCAKVQLVPWKPFNEKSRKATLGLFNSSPRSLLDTYSSQMESLICDAISSGKFDLIVASQLTMASYFPSFGGLPAVFEEIELGSFYDQAFNSGDWIRRLRSRMTWFKLRKYLSHLLDSFAVGTVVSEQERQIFTDNFSRHEQKIKVLPNCINLEDYHNLDVMAKPRHLIFSGSFRYRPNYYAMQWFIRDVYPLILERVPHAQLLITGDHAALPLPSMRNVTLSGYVNDIKSLVASCTVSIAPLWSGGGTRLKILEAMALGTPVVATSKGAEGLLIQNGENILIADEPQLFAEHVIRLLQDGDLGRSLSSNALHLVREHYDWSTVLPKFLGLIDQVAAGQM